jgi:hypothetical protein
MRASKPPSSLRLHGAVPNEAEGQLHVNNSKNFERQEKE